MNSCGCNQISEPFEFSIEDCNLGSNKIKLQELFPVVNDINELKNKIIQEYLEIIDKLECGIQLDLEFLLEEISLVDIIEHG